MGLRDLFFEKVSDDQDFVSVPIADEIEESEPNVNMDGVSVDSLISDLYENNGMSDTSKSIFKLEEVCASLPETMADATKRQSASSLLGIFGLTVDQIVKDGQKRIELINSALSDITNTSSTNISMMESQVEEHKKAIETLERDIADIKANEKRSCELIKAEAERIAGLVKFIGGE